MLPPLRRVEFLASETSDMPDCFASIGIAGAPVMVAIHGISRNAAEIAARFASHPAFEHVNIIAPLFERNRFGKYQQLIGRRSAGVRADQALFALLDHLAQTRGLAVDKVMLFGFSGGAQMAHRLAMLYPDRVRSVCAASAGWYLMPDADAPYPYGIGDGCPTPVRGDEFLDLPVTVIVGSRDTRIDRAVRQDPDIVSRQGTNRLRRARTWTRYVTEKAMASGREPQIKLITLNNVSHNFSECALHARLLDHAAAALLIS